MRSEPGSIIASYQVSTFLFPSLSMFVVFWTNVAVLYQDFAYLCCIAVMSWSLVVIFEANVAGANPIMRPIIKIKKRIVIFPLSALIEFAVDVRRPHYPAGGRPRSCF